MKTIKTTLLSLSILLISSTAFAQEEIKKEGKLDNKRLVVTAGTNGVSSKIQNDSTDNDTTKISFGKTKIIIIGSNNDDDSNDDDDDKDYGHCRGCKGQRYNHFAGIDLGVNGFLSPEMSVDLQKEGQFMDLNYRKSISLSLNIWEWYIPIAKEKLGLLSGVGFEFNNYYLDRDITLFADEDTTIGFADATKSIEKNRFKSSMINVPLMLETNIGKDAEHSFHLALGGQVSYRLGSKSKQVFDQAGKEYKVKNRNDYNMNDFRFNAVGRIGYGDFTLFASYSLTPMFDKNKGPELYPFTVGISLVSW